MPHELTGVSAEELIALARTRGYRISRSQLARWHRLGLLPRPRTRSLGRGRGTRSIYPVGTGEGLLALCQIHKEEFRLPLVAWKLWWTGYNGSVEAARTLLQRVVATHGRYMRRVIGRGNLTERGLKFVEELQEKPLRDRRLRSVSKRVGRRSLAAAMPLVIEITSGTFEQWGDLDEDPESLAKLLGNDSSEQATSIERLRSDPTPLRDLSQLIRPAQIRKVVNKATDKELTRVRDEARSLLATSSKVGLRFRALGFDPTEPLVQIAFLLVWLAFHGPVTSSAGRGGSYVD